MWFERLCEEGLVVVSSHPVVEFQVIPKGVPVTRRTHSFVQDRITEKSLVDKDTLRLKRNEHPDLLDLSLADAM